MSGNGKLLCIFGKRGSGKTHLIRESLESFPGPVAVIDVLGNFHIETTNEDTGETELLYPTTTDTAEFIGWLENYDPENSDENKIFVLMPSDPNIALDYVCAALWEIRGGTLVLDEVDAFKISEAPCFDKIIRYGRNYDINLVTGCRRPAEISRNITAGANKILVYQTQEPRDVEYFEDTVLGTEAQKLPSMLKFHGLYVDYDKGTTGEFAVDESGQVATLNEKKI